MWKFDHTKKELTDIISGANFSKELLTFLKENKGDITKAKDTSKKKDDRLLLIGLAAVEAFKNKTGRLSKTLRTLEADPKLIEKADWHEESYHYFKEESGKFKDSHMLEILYNTGFLAKVEKTIDKAPSEMFEKLKEQPTDSSKDLVFDHSTKGISESMGLPGETFDKMLLDKERYLKENEAFAITVGFNFLMHTFTMDSVGGERMLAVTKQLAIKNATEEFGFFLYLAKKYIPFEKTILEYKEKGLNKPSLIIEEIYNTTDDFEKITKILLKLL